MNTPSNITKMQEIAVNVVMETVTSMQNSLTDRADPLNEAAKEEDVLSLFTKFSDLMSPNLNWLAAEYTVVINEG